MKNICNFSTTLKGIELSTESKDNLYIIQYNYNQEKRLLQNMHEIKEFPNTSLTKKLKNTFEVLLPLFDLYIQAHNNNNDNNKNIFWWEIKDYIRNNQ
jgi:hypothetical protein